jgi:hypothetical protein
VEIERPPDTIVAREGMRLNNLDTIRTGSGSSSWLSLDDVKAVGLSELTALRIDRGKRGFDLTLITGEIRAQIDEPLYANEDFTIQAGNLALAVRGTVFTAGYDGSIVTVHVESGTVAVLDRQGNELAVLGAGESGEYETGETAEIPTQGGEQGQTPTPATSYEVGNIVEFGGYEWRVLELRDGKALLLSEYVLEFRTYHSEWYDGAVGTWIFTTTWADCDLRAYLNGEFLNSFSQSDRERIAETQVVNNDNPWLYARTKALGEEENDFWLPYVPSGGADTSDRIFLLSIEEVVQYFGDSGMLANGPRPEDEEQLIDDQYNEARSAYTADGHLVSWWLRSPGDSSFTAALVRVGGPIVVYGLDVVGDRRNERPPGVRPAMWVNLQ